jgi:hypothetical protein
MKITLLPHQIFIVPQAYDSVINKEIFSQLKIYSNEQLRYVF